MSEPFLGEIKIMAFNFPPKGWAFCNGQLLPINQNQALFSLMGTMYGGNGQTTFGLPNLQGRVPIHVGAGFTQGQVGGEIAHTVNQSEMPAHTHFMQGSSNAADKAIATGNLPASATSNVYGDANSLVAMLPNLISNVGGSQPHTNMQPYLVLNFCVALQGIFPSQN